MAGLPPFNGFLSKEMFLTAMLSVQQFELFNFETFGVLFPVVAFIASVFTFVYSFYFVFKTFTGKLKIEELPQKPHEAPIGMLVSPIILATLVVAIFFVPNLVADKLIKPAVLAIQPFLYNAPEQVDIHVSAWHGPTTELWMTLGVVALGIILFFTLAKWQKLYYKWPNYLTLNKLYDVNMDIVLEEGMESLSKLYMTGSIRQYFTYMFCGIAALVIGTLFIKDAFVVSMDHLAPITGYEIVLVFILVVGTIVAVFAKSRITAIIGLGAVGYTVALFFVIFNAPDLALTQLVIETISVALFLMVFYHMPKLKKVEERTKFKIGRFITSLAVGVMVTLVALSAHSQKLLTSISQYYEETVYSLAGGGNIVNVILVDYRGFDTLFEITVLGIAGMGIYAMIKLRLTNRKEKNNES